jgi:hypothetical protein
MSRTIRRHGARHEYRWVLSEHVWVGTALVRVRVDPKSTAGRKAIARFHSDAESTMNGAAPRWYCRVFDRRLRTLNARELRRWMDDPGYSPVFEARHRHSANWSWW